MLLAALVFSTNIISTQSNITRTKEEARQILEGIKKSMELESESEPISLGKLARTESDCSSARTEGDLGYFGRGEMQKEFEDAAFALKPGEISGIVDTASGLHLIERLVDIPFTTRRRRRRRGRRCGGDCLGRWLLLFGGALFWPPLAIPSDNTSSDKRHREKPKRRPRT